MFKLFVKKRNSSSSADDINLVREITKDVQKRTQKRYEDYLVGVINKNIIEAAREGSISTCVDLTELDRFYLYDYLRMESVERVMDYFRGLGYTAALRNQDIGFPSIRISWDENNGNK